MSKKGGKAKIEMSLPELPPFIQRMREQIVAKEREEDEERRKEYQKNRQAREAYRDKIQNKEEDCPILVRDSKGGNITEEEFERMKRGGYHQKNDTELDNEFDFDSMMSTITKRDIQQPNVSTSKDERTEIKSIDYNKTFNQKRSHDEDEDLSSKTENKEAANIAEPDKKFRRVLSYANSSDEDD